jgi:hypothetical protein
MKYAYLYTIRWSLLSIVKHTKCEINDFSIVFSAKTISWTSFTLHFYQLCGDFLQVIRWQFSHWLRLKIASGRVERDRGPVLTNHHFVPGPVVGSRRPCLHHLVCMNVWHCLSGQTGFIGRLKQLQSVGWCNSIGGSTLSSSSSWLSGHMVGLLGILVMLKCQTPTTQHCYILCLYLLPVDH